MTATIKARKHPQHPDGKLKVCVLCGQLVPHGCVIGMNVELSFKAREELDKTVWWPMPHRPETPIQNGGCPDLTREQQRATERRWRDPMFRAEWRAVERDRRTAIREGRVH